MVDVSVSVLVEVFQFYYCLHYFGHNKMLDSKGAYLPLAKKMFGQVCQGGEDKCDCRTLCVYHNADRIKQVH